MVLDSIHSVTNLDASFIMLLGSPLHCGLFLRKSGADDEKGTRWVVNTASGSYLDSKDLNFTLCASAAGQEDYLVSCSLKVFYSLNIQ